ncbi:acetylornithine deacetylase [Utexia brackfieldae]|uniref:acetylornithine deacetylase n=1 Tax=Utexia brackfieldae TaxID=3074108 RepID=UPI00370D6BB8
MTIPSFLKIYNEIISIPSISAADATIDQSNQALINQLAEWFEALGFRITITPVPNTRNKFNLLASYGEGRGGLLLSGHSDTVPFDEGQWQKNPFQLTEIDNKLYGLGTADMKGFFAFILEALRDIDLTQLKKPIHILATADEETTMSGAIYFAKTASLAPDCAIIGEPTGLVPIRAHKGHIANVIKVIGKSGHSSDPDKGVNAIEIMHQVIARLLTLRDKLKQQYHNVSFAVPYPTMNLGRIHGGDSANRICGCCELVMDIRPLPEMSIENLYDLLCQELAPVIAQWPGRLSVSYQNDPIPGYECQPDTPALKAIEALVGQPAETVNYCTEAPYLNQLTPTIVIGPGSIEQAHQPDEFLDMDFIKPTDLLLKQFIQRFCQ